MHVSGQLNRENLSFQLLKQIMDRLMAGMFRFPLRHFYDVIFVSMVAKTLLKHTPQKSGLFFDKSIKLTR